MGKNKKHKKDKKSKKKKHHKEKAESKTDSSKKKSSKSSKKSVEEVATKSAQDADYDIPLELMSNKVRAPETPEEYQKRQNRIRYEVDPVTGRKRLIKGDGEILEEIVTRKRHVEINQQATHEDGNFFQYNTTGKNNQHFSP